jgi:radical SAM superfamily enzyme YgiQ (UPF0313 family)
VLGWQAVRILLVSLNRESVPYPVAPLGLAYVAGAARRAGHAVTVLDLCFARDSGEAIAAAVAAARPELIGVSVRNVDNLTYPASVSYVSEMRDAVAALRRASRAPIVAGGAGFSIFPHRLLALLEADLGVLGEGEEAFCRVAAAVEAGQPMPELPNVVRRGGAGNGLRGHSAGRAGLAVPARDLLDNLAYLTLGGMANLQTKRGCPFRCAYCTYPHIDGPSLRLRSAGEVADELGAMREDLGLDEVFFVDDIFNWPPDHAMEVCEAILARRLSVRWTCFGTPLGMTPELARTMRRAGCRGVEFGVDTASPAVLRALHKPFEVDQIRAAAQACAAAGLPAAYYLVFGGPGETAQTVGETFRVFDDLHPRAVLAFLGMRIYPHTPLERVAMADGLIRETDDLLAPRFYVSRAIGADALQAAVTAHARSRPRWVVPGLGIRSDPALLGALRRNGHRGPLWDLL